MFRPTINISELIYQVAEKTSRKSSPKYFFVCNKLINPHRWLANQVQKLCLNSTIMVKNQKLMYILDTGSTTTTEDYNENN